MKRLSRKEFLGYGVAAGAGVVLAGSAGMGLFSGSGHHHKVAYAATAVALTPFVDPLPIPGSATGNDLTMSQFTQQLHSALPPTTVWGYNGSYPGPTIEAIQGTPTSLTYVNNLPPRHLFKVDPTIIQMRGKNAKDTRTLTHLHGGHISDVSDGNPYATVQDFTSASAVQQSVTYANDQPSAQLWYHEHAMGITRLNVMAGLAGLYMLRDDNDTGKADNPLGLPAGAYEVPLVIQDRAFDQKGQFVYPSHWAPEFFGDTALVNGKVWPFLEVEPRRYRFRILNGSNSRFYNLQLGNGQSMWQIGSDGGLFSSPVEINNLILAPAERADVIIDFAEAGAGAQIVLADNLLPTTTISPAVPVTIPNIMRFNVILPLNGTDTSTAPQNLQFPEQTPLPAHTNERFITLEEQLAGPVPRAVVLNGMNFVNPVTETPKAGSTEVWNLINISADTHPIHVHLVQFEVVERLSIDPVVYQQALAAARTAAGGPVNAAGQLVNPDPQQVPNCVTGTARVDDNEKGPKDTVRANPGQVTRIKARFDLPAGTATPAKYVYHCHILEHEDNDMMRPFEVRP